MSEAPTRRQYPLTGEMHPAQFLLMLGLGIAILLGGCAGSLLLTSTLFKKAEQAFTVELSLRDDLSRTVVVEHCRTNCGAGDGRSDRELLAPNQVYRAGRVLRFDTNNFVVSTPSGRTLGCVDVYKVLDGAAATLPLSTMVTCANVGG